MKPAANKIIAPVNQIPRLMPKTIDATIQASAAKTAVTKIDRMNEKSALVTMVNTVRPPKIPIVAIPAVVMAPSKKVVAMTNNGKKIIVSAKT